MGLTPNKVEKCCNQTITECIIKVKERIEDGVREMPWTLRLGKTGRREEKGLQRAETAGRHQRLRGQESE